MMMMVYMTYVLMGLMCREDDVGPERVSKKSLRRRNQYSKILRGTKVPFVRATGTKVSMDRVTMVKDAHGKTRTMAIIKACLRCNILAA